MSIFKDIWKGLGNVLKAIGHLFAADILPFAIDATQDINVAVKSGEAQAVVDILTGFNSGAGHLAQGILDEAKALAPKVLATELGLQALETGATAESAVAWARGVVTAYGSADDITKSKVWNTLATKLAILYDNGRTANKTWIQWAQTIEEGFQAIKQAIADNAAQDSEGAE